MPVANMSGVNETFVTQHDDRRVTELVAMLRRSRPNVLVVGSSAEVDRAFELMYPYLRTPVVAWVPRETRDLPSTPFRTIVIRDVEALDSRQQENLVAMVCRLAADVQIVSTSRTPLFPRVERGEFLNRLYYQLNVIYLDLTDRTT
jgi:hypothetical protein